ncbi:response regulator [Microbacterium gallinarum]|jgi:DNA-binding NarL/FixJ family response regulator|uniref:Response regulator transcription factor n=1 Tax=Microbacterium gallinarum TaxID=2762209 RepID=A0ABR8X6V8_9MICO|nr:response regulator transcription factor [Microbacterium gallinarum]MBD8024531.1 response regulator transcription factor [Microbacterium gallinarum]
MPDPIRVVLVDDEKLIRLGFRLVLEAEPDLEVVGEASDGAQAIEEVRMLRPDVVLMDVRMPRMDGIEATRQLVAQHPVTRIVVLTTFDLDEYAFAALRAGASGFLLKDAHPHELTAAIRAAHGGDAVLAPRVTRRMLEMFGDRLPDTVPAGSPGVDLPSALTEREHEVFVAMARGLTNAEIGAELFVSESTVKTHVGRVLAKLGARDRVHAVILAHRMGIIPDDASSGV